MRKSLVLLCVCAFAGMAIVACSSRGDEQGSEQRERKNEQSDKQKDEIVLPAAVSDETIIAFFVKHLPQPSGLGKSDFFPDGTYGDLENVCLVINSAEELSEIASFTEELPKIDFDEYTLILGQVWVGASSYYPTDLSIEATSEQLVLNIVPEHPDNIMGYATMCPLYYWGLYEKLPSNPVVVEVEYSYQ